MDIVVTGGAGFLGTRLIRALLTIRDDDLSQEPRTRRIVSLDVAPCPVDDARVHSEVGSITDPAVTARLVGPRETHLPRQPERRHASRGHTVNLIARALSAAYIFRTKEVAMTNPGIPRRGLLRGAAASIAGLSTVGRLPAQTIPGAAFRYEVTRSDAEWQALLTPTEYEILRGGRTEFPRSSALWDENDAGIYHCKGCALPVFESGAKVPLDKGWAFFRHARENALLTRPEHLPPGYAETDDNGAAGPGTIIEIHCRRCGSHLGHILLVEDEILHCVNGSALTFAPTPA